jgi:hypothetical protein
MWQSMKDNQYREFARRNNLKAYYRMKATDIKNARRLMGGFLTLNEIDSINYLEAMGKE